MFCNNRTPSPISLFVVIVGTTRCLLVSTVGNPISCTEVSFTGEACRECDRVIVKPTDIVHFLALNYTTHVNVGSGLIHVYGIPKLKKSADKL